MAGQASPEADDPRQSLLLGLGVVLPLGGVGYWGFQALGLEEVSKPVLPL